MTQRAVKAKIDDRINAARYRKLRAWLRGGRKFTWELRNDSEDAASFDLAVDALPEPESAEQNQEVA